MNTLRLRNALQQCVADGQCRFLTYGEFAKQYRFSDYAPAWASRTVLDAVAQEFRSNNMLDLTFLLRNKRTGYPSVIDGRASKPPSQEQKERARAVAQQIIDNYAPGTSNPY